MRESAGGGGGGGVLFVSLETLWPLLFLSLSLSARQEEKEELLPTERGPTGAAKQEAMAATLEIVIAKIAGVFAPHAHYIHYSKLAWRSNLAD